MHVRHSCPLRWVGVCAGGEDEDDKHALTHLPERMVQGRMARFAHSSGSCLLVALLFPSCGSTECYTKWFSGYPCLGNVVGDDPDKIHARGGPLFPSASCFEQSLAHWPGVPSWNPQ